MSAAMQAAAEGPVAFPMAIGAPIGRTGSPMTFFAGAATFYLAAVAINWWYYTRKGCERPS